MVSGYTYETFFENLNLGFNITYFDIFIEAVGNPNLLSEGISYLRPRGQALMIGVHPEMSNLDYDLYDLHYREIKLFGAFGRGNYFSCIF
mgnify:CR=1 FL=1